MDVKNLLKLKTLFNISVFNKHLTFDKLYLPLYWLNNSFEF